MNISLLDQIDKDERYQEIRDDLDRMHDEESDDDEASHLLDVNLSYSSTVDSENTNRDMDKTASIVGVSPVKHTPTTASDEENESYSETQELEKLKLLSKRENRSDNDNEVIHRLVHSLHQKNTDCRAIELQYNHLKLQNDSLLHQERKWRETVNSLEFEIAVSEENVSLLEEKLKNVANFEDGYAATSSTSGPGSSGSHVDSMDKLRGTLLNASHRQIYDLEQELRQLRRVYDNETQQFSEKLLHVQSQNQALREEAQSLGESLAQRTVLFSAQERRCQTHQRVSSMDIEGKAEELVRTSAMLQQLESQCAQLDRERIDLLMFKKEHEETIEALRGEGERERERKGQLEEELAEALEINKNLQDTISLLRGSDMEELERGMAQEVENIRSEAKATEEGLRRELAEARDLLQAEGNRGSLLQDQAEQHRSKLGEVTGLLREVWARSGLDSTEAARISLSGEMFDSLGEVLHDGGGAVWDMSTLGLESFIGEGVNGGQRSEDASGGLIGNPMSSFISDSSRGSSAALLPPSHSAVGPSIIQPRRGLGHHGMVDGVGNKQGVDNLVSSAVGGSGSGGRQGVKERLDGSISGNSEYQSHGGDGGDEELFSVASIFWKMKVNNSHSEHPLAAGSLDSGQLSGIESRKKLPSHEAVSNHTGVMSSIESSDSFHLKYCHPAVSSSYESISGNPLGHVRVEGRTGVGEKVVLSNRYSSLTHGSCSDEEGQERDCEQQGDTKKESSDEELCGTVSADKVLHLPSDIDMQYITVLSVLLRDLIHLLVHVCRTDPLTPVSSSLTDTPSMLQKGICRFILGVKAPMHVSRNDESASDFPGPLSYAQGKECGDDDVLRGIDALPLTRDEMVPVQELIGAIGTFMEAVPEAVIREAEARSTSGNGRDQVVTEESGVFSGKAELEGRSPRAAIPAGHESSPVLLDCGTDCDDLAAVPLVTECTEAAVGPDVCSEMMEAGTDMFDFVQYAGVEVATDTLDMNFKILVDVGTEMEVLESEKANVLTSTEDLVCSGPEVSDSTSDTADLAVLAPVCVSVSTCTSGLVDTCDVEVNTEQQKQEEESAHATFEHKGTGEGVVWISEVDVEAMAGEVISIGTDTRELTPMLCNVEVNTDEVRSPVLLDAGTDATDMMDMLMNESGTEIDGMSLCTKEVSTGGVTMLEHVASADFCDENKDIRVTDALSSLTGPDVSDSSSDTAADLTALAPECVSVSTCTNDLVDTCDVEVNTEQQQQQEDEEGGIAVLVRGARGETLDETTGYDEGYVEVIASGGDQPEAGRLYTSEDDEEKELLRKQLAGLRDEVAQALMWQKSAAQLATSLITIEERNSCISALEMSLSAAREETCRVTAELEASRESNTCAELLQKATTSRCEAISDELRSEVAQLSASLSERDGDVAQRDRQIETTKELCDAEVERLKAEIMDLSQAPSITSPSLLQESEVTKWKSLSESLQAEVARLLASLSERDGDVAQRDRQIEATKELCDAEVERLKEQRVQLQMDVSRREESIKAMKEDVTHYARRSQEKWKDAKHALKSKYKHKVETLQQYHDEEMKQLVERVKAECADIYSEVKRAEEDSRKQTQQLKEEYEAKLQEKESTSPRSSFSFGHRQSLSGSNRHSNGDRTRDSVGTGARAGKASGGFTPEMLSPEQTQELVRSILSRSAVTSVGVSVLETTSASIHRPFHSEQKQQVRGDSQTNRHSDLFGRPQTNDENKSPSPSRDRSRSYDINSHSSVKHVRNSVTLETRDMILHALQGGTFSDVDMSGDSIGDGSFHNVNRDKEGDLFGGGVNPSGSVLTAAPPRHPPPPEDHRSSSAPMSPPRTIAGLAPALSSVSPLIHQHGTSSRLQRRGRQQKQQDPT